jgi:hypothetical protein
MIEQAARGRQITGIVVDQRHTIAVCRPLGGKKPETATDIENPFFVS